MEHISHRTRSFLPAIALTAVLVSLGALGAPATAEHPEGWQSLLVGEDCIGGTRCGSYRDTLVIPLEGGPLEAIRILAHDNVGRHHNGTLRVAVGSQVIADYVEVSRSANWIEIDARGARGRDLVVTAIGDDEVVIQEVAALYVGNRGGGYGDRPGSRARGRDWARGSGWVEVDRGACIGGGICRDRNGDVLEVALSGRPVEAVRFFAHDRIGRMSRGALRVSLGNRVIEHHLEIEKQGRWYEIDTGGIPARYLVFETLTNDEVEIESVEVLYGGEHGRHGDRRGRRYR